MLVTSSSEGSPVAVREALACNLPIVSVDVGDVADHIASIDGCAVVRDYDPESIADALAANLTTNRPINGRARMERFDNGVLVKKVIEVYRKAAASHVSRENGEWM
jgi:glycosyltransferase involved in cell wall biosynthesis